MAYKNKVTQRIYNRNYQRKRRKLIKEQLEKAKNQSIDTIDKIDVGDIHKWPVGAD